jgi:hypothetical protein
MLDDFVTAIKILYAIMAKEEREMSAKGIVDAQKHRFAFISTGFVELVKSLPDVAVDHTIRRTDALLWYKISTAVSAATVGLAAVLNSIMLGALLESFCRCHPCQGLTLVLPCIVFRVGLVMC